MLRRAQKENHARRFCAYNARTASPLDLTGSGSANLNTQVTEIHNAEAAQRQADIDALSTQIDPFPGEVDLDCE